MDRTDSDVIADAGGTEGHGAGLSQRIDRAASDFARLLQACGAHQRRDTFAEQLGSMERLLGR